MKIKGLIKGVKGVMEDAMNGNYLSYKYVRKMDSFTSIPDIRAR